MPGEIMSALPTTVRLYGEMGRMFGRTHRFFLDSNTPAEAVRALIANFPKIEAYLVQSKDRGVGFSVFRGKQNLEEKELTDPTISGDIRIAPMIIGSKSGGVFSIIVGVILLAVSYFVPVLAPYLAPIGWGMIAGGIVQLLTPAPKGLNKAGEAAANQASYVFSGAVNTQAQGNPVPVLYGELIVGSAVISAGIQAEDVIASQGATGGAHGGMGGGGCVEANSIVHVVGAYSVVEAIRAADVRVGDVLQGYDPDTLEPATAVVTYSETVQQACVELLTVGGVRLACSRSAPIPTSDGLAMAPELLGKLVLVRVGENDHWSEAVREVRDIGPQWVQHISINDGCFWAGDTADAQILHHNKLNPAQSPS
jgi:predicted phage tail protein